MIQSPRKISSALAKFENTINKNKESGSLRSKSFLTGTAGSRGPEYKRRSSLSEVGSSAEKLPTSQISKRRGSLLVGSSAEITASPLITKKSKSVAYHRGVSKPPLPAGGPPESDATDTISKDVVRSPSVDSCSVTSAESTSTMITYGEAESSGEDCGSGKDESTVNDYGYVEGDKASEPETDYGYGEPVSPAKGHGYSSSSPSFTIQVEHRAARRNSCLIRDQQSKFAFNLLEGPAMRMSERDVATSSSMIPSPLRRASIDKTASTMLEVTQGLPPIDSRRQMLSRGGNMISRGESKRILINAMSSPLKSPKKKARSVALPKLNLNLEANTIMDVADSPKQQQKRKIKSNADDTKALRKTQAATIRSLQKQLDELYIKKEEDLCQIREETEKKKLEFLERATARAEKTSKREDKLHKVEEGQNQIKCLREDNSSIRVKNLELRPKVVDLKENIACLEASTAKSKDYHEQLKGHHEQLTQTNKRLADYESKMIERVTKVEQDARTLKQHCETEHKTKNCYQKAMLFTADMIERCKDERLKDMVNEYIVRALDDSRQIKQTLASKECKAEGPSKLDTVDADAYSGSNSDSDSESDADNEAKNEAASRMKVGRKVKATAPCRLEPFSGTNLDFDTALYRKAKATTKRLNEHSVGQGSHNSQRVAPGSPRGRVAIV